MFIVIITVTEADSLDAAAEALKQYANTFAITDGASGALTFDGNATRQSIGVPATAIDTNVAGDRFAGAFLYAITLGRDYSWAANLANEYAARVVARFGPRLDRSDFDNIKAKFRI